MNQPLFIKWTEHNETGIVLIDEQHKGIVSIINTFYYMMSAGADNKMMYSCISDTMKNYSRIHFITEEGFLKESGYVDIEEHKSLHRKLSIEIEQIELNCIINNDALELLEFLKRWWIEHINEKDQLYAQHLRKYANNRVNRT
jgi:hemerythrin-like metal-binding protein